MYICDWHWLSFMNLLNNMHSTHPKYHLIKVNMWTSLSCVYTISDNNIVLKVAQAVLMSCFDWQSKMFIMVYTSQLKSCVEKYQTKKR